MVFHYNVVCNIVAISIENFFSFKFIDNSTGSEFRPRKKKKSPRDKIGFGVNNLVFNWKNGIYDYDDYDSTFDK